MQLIICLLLFCGSLYAATTTQRPEDTETIPTIPSPAASAPEAISGTVLEKLLARFDQLDLKLLELKNELSEHREEVKRNRTPDCVTPTTTTTQTIVTEPPIYASCKDVPTNVSGVYFIRLNNASAPFKVYCEMEKFDGGWIVVQHRFDGSVDFHRNWDEYRDGFGELDGEFWLGLQRIHQVTTARKYELIVEVKDFTGKYGYARYSEIQVGNEGSQYSLKTIGSYDGTAGDSLTISKGYKFSTKDRKDASSATHYAVSYEGAWWHNGGYANLNGRYKHDADGTANWWYTLKNDARGLSFSRMMIREL